MKNNKHITLLEIIILIALLCYIVIRWTVTSVSVGDFFCLELLAMMFWYRYDNFKN
jgi:hypothetical protein